MFGIKRLKKWWCVEHELMYDHKKTIERDDEPKGKSENGATT